MMWNPPSVAQQPLSCLTLLRPWEICFTATEAELGVRRKDIENRVWPPPAKYIGTRIALHAGKGWDESGAAFMRGLGVPQPVIDRSEPSRIVAVVKINAKWERGTLRTADPDFPYDSPWLFGPWAWWVSDIQVLRTPVPCNGHQGLWRVPEADARLVRSQVQGLP